jgi:hypothetical protein
LSQIFRFDSPFRFGETGSVGKRAQDSSNVMWHPGQGLIRLIGYSYQQGIPSFQEAHLKRTPG